MIKHIVMWTLKDEAEGATKAENAKKMMEMLNAMSGKIWELKHLEVCDNVFLADPPCDVALYSEFATRADLDAYQKHPIHQACVTFIKKIVKERRVVDYEIV